MRNKWLIEEIWKKFHENDYPGSSLNCGVYPLFYNHGKSVALYYPAKNCILLDDDKIIKYVYSHAQADRLMEKYMVIISKENEIITKEELIRL